ncbi:MAG TPA: CHASE3 domain-containing protein [Coleofasciculaceae cyanobacterium]|jgi:signal transduction histidine kinase
MSIFAKEFKWNRFWSRVPTKYRRAIIIAIPIVSIIPAMVGWTWSRQAKGNAYWWINHTQQVINDSNVLLQFAINAETGLRGYALTRQTEFLEPYNQATQEIPVYLEQLEILISDNKRQQQNLQKLEQNIQTTLNSLAQSLNILKSDPQLENNSQLIKIYSQGKAEMDRLRNSIDVFKDEEWRLLNLRQQKIAQIEQVNNIFLGITIVSGVLSYWLAMRLYYQSETELEKKAQEISQTNQNLSLANKLLEERNQELNQFAYVVSHDLKAPLRAIANLSEWLEEDLQDKLDENTSKHLILIRSRVQRMTSFIDGLLEYSRAGRVNSQKTIVDVQKLLDEIIDSLAPRPDLVVKINGKMPTIETKALPLQQVFSNLISNAIKHHHRQDGLITISVLENPEYYQFSVADDGVGIAPEHQEKIFIIFQTLTTKDKTENTGIGLSIVKRIIDNQGEKIWLESQPNQGTTFHFTWAKN